MLVRAFRFMLYIWMRIFHGLQFSGAAQVVKPSRFNRGRSGRRWSSARKRGAWIGTRPVLRARITCEAVPARRSRTVPSAD